MTVTLSLTIVAGLEFSKLKRGWKASGNPQVPPMLLKLLLGVNLQVAECYLVAEDAETSTMCAPSRYPLLALLPRHGSPWTSDGCPNYLV